MILEGIVIKERPFGEYDKFIDVLTHENGIIEIFVKGARRINGKSSSSTQLFAYSKFCIQLRRDKYRLDSVEPICIFYNLRNNIEKLSVASYFADVLGYSVPSQAENDDILRLFLNTLHFLETNKRTPVFLKSLFELRLMSDIGMMPNIIACKSCGCYEPQNIVFDISDGHFLCEDCCDEKISEAQMRANLPVLNAVRHIVLSDLNRLYNFKISDETQAVLSRFAERYLITHMERNFKTLDFYKSVKN